MCRVLAVSVGLEKRGDVAGEDVEVRAGYAGNPGFPEVKSVSGNCLFLGGGGGAWINTRNG